MSRGGHILYYDSRPDGRRQRGNGRARTSDGRVEGDLDLSRRPAGDPNRQGRGRHGEGGDATAAPVATDGPPDEVDLGTVLEQEAGRLAHHPRIEAARLRNVADAGQKTSAVYIEIATVARVVIPVVLLIAGIVLAVYYLSQ